MDPDPLDSKRSRFTPWPGTTSQQPNLPHPHPPTAPPHLPPPPHAQHTSPAYQSYPPRHSDHSPNHPPTTTSPHGMPLQHSDVDRHHHDAEPLAPMQDYRHLPQSQPSQPHPHSPAQQHYSAPYSLSRDFLVKREGPDDGRRPTSAAHASDSAHGPPPHPHAFPPDPSRNLTYDNAQQHSSALINYRHHTGPSTSMQPPLPQSYDAQPTYASSADQVYGIYHTPSQLPPKKKNTRASQACDSCRQLKAKCDELRPCKTCKDRGTECKYRDPPPKVADKTQSDILEGIALMQNQLSNLTDKVARMEERFTKLESSITHGFDLAASKQRSALDDPYKSESTPFNGVEVVKYSGPDYIMTTPDQTTLPEDEVETEPGPAPPPGEPAIPRNHTTLASLLLDWPSISELTKQYAPSEGVGYIGEYPVGQEQGRGALIVYGRGEDNRLSRRQREREPDQPNLDLPDDSCDPPSPATATEALDWGTLGGFSPYDQIDYQSGVLGPDGYPDFSESKVWSYVQTFKENILNMHPIVQPPILDQWVRQFLDSLPVSSHKVTHTTKDWALSSSVETTGSKRKRSVDDTDSLTVTTPVKVGRPNRTIHTALILTVLACGKVCQHRDYVPDALHNGDPMPRGSHLHLNGASQSPKQGSSSGYASRSQSSNLPSPRDPDRPTHSRRSSLHGNPRSGLFKKNYENIPGLEYFAFATDILGNYLGSYNNMKNIYADIFGSLFQGQLGRPLESFGYIHRASHKLQVIMRPSLDKLKKFKSTNQLLKDTKYNQLSLAFWTCLQLESDLLAELNVPPSGLLSYENDIPHPNMSLLQGFPKPVLDSYLGQLYLRTHLNSIHRMFYGPEDPSNMGPLDIPFKNVDLVSEAVSGMEWVGPSFAFKEDDPPAKDILSARLRAKYWGAQVLTYRPFLRQILQFSYVKAHPRTGQAPSSEFRDEVEAPRIDPQARNVDDLDPKIVMLARKAIKALIESTRAFHGLGDKRPIITSVFGTAHAQWGNLLVLSAAFKDPIMSEYVEEGLLRHLFEKTINFLRQSATATSTLRVDMHILEGLQRGLFGVQRAASSSNQRAGSEMETTPRRMSNSMGMPPPRNMEVDGTLSMHHNRLTPTPSHQHQIERPRQMDDA